MMMMMMKRLKKLKVEEDWMKKMMRKCKGMVGRTKCHQRWNQVHRKHCCCCGY